MLQPRLPPGSALLLTLGGVSSQVLNTTTAPVTNITTPAKANELNVAAIVAPIVVVLVLVLVGALLFLFCVVKKKRQTEGTYRPSAEEQTGTRSVETPNALKLPKEERLI